MNLSTPKTTMNNPFLLSVIIPFHNRFNLLNELLDSIPDIPCLEIILINDSSDSKFLPECNFSSASLVIKDLPVSAGRYAGSARNYGFSISSGHYTMFSDSDDVFNSSTFLKVLSCIQVLDFDVFFTPISSFHFEDKLRLVEGVKSRTFKYNHILFEYVDSRDIDVLRRFVVPHGKIIKSDFLKQHSLSFEPVKCSNDVLFASQLIDHSPSVSVLDHCFYNVRQGAASLTTRRDVSSILVRLSVLHRFNHSLTLASRPDLYIPALPFLMKLPFWQALKHILFLVRQRHPIMFSRFSFYLFLKINIIRLLRFR